ncbi:hypothetical protein [Pseudarthrobacter sp. NamE5]|uniref:hypothetical protein n=1 Tax=Pseudarthrobacter sp. NamE5 TaxID=2576839 RepID=UPI001F0DF777|nr:hypothetical protein [Pseudarthrobacter sp. NamE5]
MYVPLQEAPGRVLTSPVNAIQPLPHYVSSAMDGWAVNGTGSWLLIEAGRTLTHGPASVIATGGMAPEGAQAVLRKESGRVVEDANGKPALTLQTLHRGEPCPGQHLRSAGYGGAGG